ncbi:hypothetical protein [Schaalia meyeri]|uniref:hypothetical protein n=1 Tax=Schaalia meyeri TaxID=52773 RepID=UPI0012FEF655|nr:hypothetical protein [Schaalia meyeri]
MPIPPAMPRKYSHLGASAVAFARAVVVAGSGAVRNMVADTGSSTGGRWRVRVAFCPYADR